MSVRSMMLAVVLLHWGVAGAQTPPAGNQYEQARSPSGVQVGSPFGQPAEVAGSTESKIELAQGVNLAGLRDLALYHNGRVKILGTLANETMFEILGRKDYIDFVPEGTPPAVRVRKVHYEPLFTFVDMVIDPRYYYDKPLIGVNYLPLREAILERVFPGQDPAAVEARERWKKVGRLTPGMIGEHGPALFNSGTTDQQVGRGLNDINEAVSLYVRSGAGLALVPASEREKPWEGLESLPAGSPIRVAAEELGAGWRAGDVARVNAAITVLASELPKVNAAVYPTSRRSLEAFYNHANLFEWGMWAYAVATLTLLLAFGTGRAWLRFAGVGVLVLAVVLHAVGFGLRSYIAERYAIQNQFESMTGVSLFAAVIGLVLLLSKRQMIFAAAAAGTGFLVLVVATQMGIPGKDVNREAAILNTSILLKYHVSTVLLSYGLITLGMVVSLFYLGTYYAARVRGKAGEPAVAEAGGGGGGGQTSGTVSAAALGLEHGPGAPPVGGIARVLGDLDRAQMTILQLAFWTLGVGILLGAWWADHSWGRWWAFDPKELWALVTWIIYLIVIHVRKAGVKNPGLTTAWLSLLGFVVMLWCYFGVNLLLPGLHAYA